MEAKKTLLTYTGLKKLERSKKPENRETFQRTLSTMQQRTSSVISRHVSKNLRKFSRMQKL